MQELLSWLRGCSWGAIFVYKYETYIEYIEWYIFCKLFAWFLYRSLYTRILIIISMNPILITIIALVLVLIIVYTIVYRILSQRIAMRESLIVWVFLQKIAKIPAVIEVMRPYVIDEHLSFDLMTGLHSESIIHEYTSVPMLLEHNARINDQYGFLMRLSMAIPELQRDVYFIYIREFVISYDRTIRSDLPAYNALIKKWNLFISIKNRTLIGYILPGREMVEI
jgi:hypothetical protein